MLDNSRIIFKMFRVLFRVIKVYIHIRQTINLQVIIKKNKQTVINKNNYALIDGIANIDFTSQFYISKEDPQFEVLISLNHQKCKKLVGYICINLNDWQKNNNYQEIRNLQKSPGGKAIIQFGFVYLDCPFQKQEKQLISLQEFENQKINKYKSRIEVQNISLKQKLNNLYNQKEQLQRKQVQNETLFQSKQTQNQFTKELLYQELKMVESEYSLKEEQIKRDFLINLVKNSGEEELIRQLKDICQMDIQQQIEHNSPLKNEN